MLWSYTSSILSSRLCSVLDHLARDKISVEGSWHFTSESSLCAPFPWSQAESLCWKQAFDLWNVISSTDSSGMVRHSEFGDVYWPYGLETCSDVIRRKANARLLVITLEHTYLRDQKGSLGVLAGATERQLWEAPARRCGFLHGHSQRWQLNQWRQACVKVRWTVLGWCTLNK